MQLRDITILFSFIILLSTNSYSSETFEFENSIDIAYLPYKSYEARDLVLAEDCSYPENNLIEVIKPAIANKNDGLLILSNNPPPNSSGFSMFTPRTFPGFEVTDDDPIRYVITIWTAFNFANDSSTYIVGVCHNDDSIFAFKLYLDSDSIEYKTLYSKESVGEKSIVPLATVLYAGDLNQDGTKEILLYVEHHRYFRKLYCLDFNTLNTKWEKKISSGVNNYTFQAYEHPDNPRIMFSTGNSANGMKDSIYNDYFSFLTILDGNGEFLFNKILSLYGRRPPIFIKSGIDNELFITHYLDFENRDSTASKSRDEYYLSRMNASGELLKSINIKSTPVHLWVMRIGKDNELKLFVLFGSKAISIFDYDLNLINEIEPLENSMYYCGRIKIAGEEDSVYVFGDGLYNKNLNKLLQFPFISSSFSPVEYDTLGNVTAYVISEHLHYYIGYIKKKTNIELVSVFYHRNKMYVLMFLTSLLVGLVTTNFFRRRSQSNLILISKQKIELEKTHQSLKDAQATIVAQEKFRQAKDIAGGFAHEIRNNLFPAKSAINKLLTGSADQLEDREWIKKIGRFSDSSIDRAIKLTEHISNYTKLESQHQPEEVDLIKIISEVLEANKDRIENNKVNINFDNKETISVNGNNEQFYIVFNNLILNALDALKEKEKGQIDIITDENSEDINVSVKDNGCGIKPDDIKKIFEFFYSTKPSSGVGLGLALVKKILDLYDSSIEVVSTIDKGTEFILSFKKCNQMKVN